MILRWTEWGENRKMCGPGLWMLFVLATGTSSLGAFTVSFVTQLLLFPFYAALNTHLDTYWALTKCYTGGCYSVHNVENEARSRPWGTQSPVDTADKANDQIEIRSAGKTGMLIPCCPNQNLSLWGVGGGTLTSRICFQVKRFGRNSIRNRQC